MRVGWPSGETCEDYRREILWRVPVSAGGGNDDDAKRAARFD